MRARFCPARFNNLVDILRPAASSSFGKREDVADLFSVIRVVVLSANTRLKIFLGVKSCQ